MSICRRFALCVLFVVSPLVAQADVVLDWNVRMFATISGQSPFGTARLAAITQLAVFEAVNAITKTYEPYLGTIEAPDGAFRRSGCRGGRAHRAQALLSLASGAA